MVNTAGDKMLVGGSAAEYTPNAFVVCLLRGFTLIFTLQRLRGYNESDPVHNHSHADYAVAKLE